MFDFPGEGGNSIPPVTAAYLAGVVALTVLCASSLLSPMSIYYSLPLILSGQVWRLVSHFFFLGTSLTLDFALHLFMFMRYSRDLEERCFLNRSVEYLWMLTLGAAALTAVATVFRLMIMSTSLGFMVTYVWARRNPELPMAPMFGLFRFRAPYLPWVLLAFSFLSGSDVAADLTGLLVGHVYYYLEFVAPLLRADRRRVLATPRWFYYLCLSSPPTAEEARLFAAARGLAPPLPANRPAPAAIAAGAGAGLVAPAAAAAGAVAGAGVAAEVMVPNADPEVVRRNLEIAARRRVQLERLRAQEELERQQFGVTAAAVSEAPPAPAPAPAPAAAAASAAAAVADSNDNESEDEAEAEVELTPEQLRQARLRARAAGLGSPSVNLYG